MLPGDELSSTHNYARFVGSRALPVSAIVDYEDGGIAIGDASQGNRYQRWRARLIGNDVILDAAEVEPFVAYSGANITEISFTFDQNMRFALAFVQAGVAKMYWFSSGVYVTTTIPDAITPRVALDDKRQTQTNSSDIILAYVKNEGLYYRQQRDSYSVERLLDAGPHKGVIKIGMNKNIRLQFLMDVGR